LAEPGAVPEAGPWCTAIIRPGGDHPGTAADGMAGVPPAGDLFDTLARAVVAALPRPAGVAGLSADALAAEFRRGEGALLVAQALSLLPPAAPPVGKAAPGPQRLFLLVDQMEELFGPEGPDANAREAFGRVLARMAAAQGRIWVVATLRSDYWHRLAEVPSLHALTAGEATYLLAPPRGEEIAQMIRAPAEAAGIGFETDPDTQSGLDDILLAGAADDPNALPLLEFALDTLYARDIAAGGGRVLTLATYRALGGTVAGEAETGSAEGFADIVAAEAERVCRAIGAIDASGRETPALRDILLPLAYPARGDAGAKARAAQWSELCLSRDHERVITALVNARLLVGRGRIGDAAIPSAAPAAAEASPAGGEPAGEAVAPQADAAPNGNHPISIRVAHESLLWHWPRYAQLLAEELDLLSLRDHVSEVERSWRTHDRDRNYLLQGGPLAAAQDVIRDRPNAFPDHLRDFVRVSSQQQSRSVRRLRAMAAIFAIVAVLATVAGYWALTQQREAERQAARAEEQSGIAEQQREAAEAAAQAAEDAQAEAERQGALATVQRDLATAEAERATAAQTLAEEAAAAAQDARAQAETSLLAARTQQAIGLVLLARERIRLGDPIEGARLALSAAPQRNAQPWPTIDQIDGLIPALHEAAWQSRQIGRLDLGEPIEYVATNRDGTVLAALHHGSVTVVTGDACWTRDASCTIREIGSPTLVDSVLLSPSGRYVVVFGIQQGGLGFRLFSTESGNLIFEDAVSGPVDMIYPADFSRDESVFYYGNEGQVNSLALRADHGDATLSSQQFSQCPVGAARRVPDSRDDLLVWTISCDEMENDTVARIDMNTGVARWVYELPPPNVSHLPSGLSAFSVSTATGSVFLTRPDGLVANISLADGEAVSEFYSEHQGGVYRGVISNTGGMIATSTGYRGNAIIPFGDSAVRLWDASSGDLLHVLQGHSSIVYDMVFDESDDVIWTASADGTVRAWDTHDGRQLEVISIGSGMRSITPFVWGRDAMMVSGSADGMIHVWYSDRFLQARSLRRSGFFNTISDPRVSIQELPSSSWVFVHYHDGVQGLVSLSDFSQPPRWVEGMIAPYRRLAPAYGLEIGQLNYPSDASGDNVLFQGGSGTPEYFVADLASGIMRVFPVFGGGAGLRFVEGGDGVVGIDNRHRAIIADWLDNTHVAIGTTPDDDPDAVYPLELRTNDAGSISVVVMNSGNELRVVDLSDRSILRTITVPCTFASPPSHLRRGTLDFSPSARFVWFRCGSALFVYDIHDASGDFRISDLPRSGNVNWADNGDLLRITEGYGAEKSVQVWSLESRRPVFSFQNSETVRTEIIHFGSGQYFVEVREIFDGSDDYSPNASELNIRRSVDGVTVKNYVYEGVRYENYLEFDAVRDYVMEDRDGDASIIWSLEEERPLPGVPRQYWEGQQVEMQSIVPGELMRVDHRFAFPSEMEVLFWNLRSEFAIAEVSCGWQRFYAPSTSTLVCLHDDTGELDLRHIFDDPEDIIHYWMEFFERY
ncbi:MAG: hypothetical protein H6842_01505, partial [Rhodospirillaceae bacterium]|nr:hypothetical protein [Rhodospirillaceae bacterium]